MAVGHAKYPTLQSLEYSYRHSRRFFLFLFVKLDNKVFPHLALGFPWSFYTFVCFAIEDGGLCALDLVSADKPSRRVRCVHSPSASTKLIGYVDLGLW